MATIIEEKVDILIDLADETLKLIPKEHLTKNALQSLLQDLETNPDIIVMLLLKMDVNSIVNFFEQGIINEQYLKSAFLDEQFTRTKVLEILKKIPVEKRKAIINYFHEFEIEKFYNIESDLDVKYGIVEGIIVKDISKNTSKLSNKEQFMKLFNNAEIAIDFYYQFLDSIYRSNPLELKKIFKELIDNNIDLLNQNALITSQEEFAKVVKTAYFFAIDKSLIYKNKEKYQNLLLRIKASLYTFNSSQAINLILKQLPEIVTKEILDLIEKETRVKKMEIRNKAIKILRLIKAEK